MPDNQEEANMRPMVCAAAALMFAFMVACNDRDRQDTASRIDTAAEEAGEDVREGAEDVENTAEKAGQDVREGAEDVDSAAKDAVDDVRGYSYERRDEFRREVRERLDRMDAELAELERDAGEDAGEARRDAVAAARDARQAIDRNVERLGEATESNWDELKRRVSEALDSADRALRALRSDAKPMGGTGGPS
jgi:gas vesicle protein